MRRLTTNLRWVWTQITSMRTALFLLFLVALAAIPGSLIPQQGASPIKVRQFRTDHPELDRIYQPLGLYSVYSSPWFSAIYLLLFLSLIGCIVPRIRVYARALRSQPPRLPSRLDRLPEHRVAELGATGTEDALVRAEQWLKRKHFRVQRSEAGVSAERGYLREFGNLLFHIALVFTLLGIAWNNLMGFKGSAVVVEGQGFSNTITQYDEYHAGAWVDTDELPPFTVALKKFFVRFETGSVQRGAPRDFRADVDLTSDGATKATQIRVNHPLDVDGTKVHILSFGYAVHVTVTDGKGNVAFSGPVVFLQQDGNFLSNGVIKVPDAQPKRLAFQGVFLPTAPEEGMMSRSLFPEPLNPKLFLNVWTGDPKVETGRPENVFALDTTGMTQLKDGDDLLRVALAPGEQYTLPNGQGTIAFDGWSHWSRMQISRAPGLPLTFGSIALAVLGLCLSLFVRPRRLWLREVDGRLECGGLDRADARTGLSEDVDELFATALGRDHDPEQAAPAGATPQEEK